MKYASLYLMSALSLSLLASCGESADTDEGDVEVVDTTGNEAEEVTYMVDTAATTVTWKGEKLTGDNHVGTVKVQSGTVIMKGDQVVGGEIIVDLTTMKNTDLEDPKYNAKLLDHLKSDQFFAVETYPTAKLTLTGMSEGGDVVGELAIRDSVQTVSFPATLSTEGDMLSGTATLTFNRTKYGVNFQVDGMVDIEGALKDGAIKHEIVLTIDLKATK